MDGGEVVAEVDGEAGGEMKGGEAGGEDGYVKEKVTASQWQCDQVIPEWKPWKFHVLPHSSQLNLFVFPTLCIFCILLEVYVRFCVPIL